jgi:hypothetical protein
MQLDAVQLVLRPRTAWAGCDLGIRLLQANLAAVYRSFLAVAAVCFALCLATYPILGWLPVLLLWLAKPWLDRTILFALSRALFGEATTLADLWNAQREVWWRRGFESFTLRRLTGSRSFTEPVHQLEGLSGAPLRARLRQLAPKQRNVARLMTQSFAAAEFALLASVFSLQIWLAPRHFVVPWQSLVSEPSTQGLLATLAYALAIAFVEPFYVAAGFGMYLNRRVELEAWDIEQEFRRAFAAP